MKELGRPFVAIVLGSESDRKIVDESGLTDTLDVMGIGWEMSYISAHRNSEALMGYVLAGSATVDVFIAAAGMSAALPGAITAICGGITPVIGVPLPSTEFPDCQDAMLSMLRMPPGMPVIVPGIGKSGLKNAAIAAAQILAIGSNDTAGKLCGYMDNTAKPAQQCVERSRAEEEVQA